MRQTIRAYIVEQDMSCRRRVALNVDGGIQIVCGFEALHS